jgi:hypothetical protein
MRPIRAAAAAAAPYRVLKLLLLLLLEEEGSGYIKRDFCTFHLMFNFRGENVI